MVWGGFCRYWTATVGVNFYRPIVTGFGNRKTMSTPYVSALIDMYNREQFIAHHKWA
jgi:hypothetical protein